MEFGIYEKNCGGAEIPQGCDSEQQPFVHNNKITLAFHSAHLLQRLRTSSANLNF
jgi:hypothetical protein